MVVKQLTRKELLSIALFMGFSAGIIQVLLIREILTLCRGNELIIGMIYFSWFLSIYIGAGFRPAANRKVLERRVRAAVFLLPVLAALSIYSSHLMQIFFPRLVGTFYSISAEFLFSFLFTLPVSFFAGFFFPSLVSLISTEAKEQSGGIIYYFESMGSFAGGIIFSFVLVDIANPLAITSMLLFFAIAIIFAEKKRRFLALILIPVILIFFSEKIENKIFTYVWNRTHTGKLIQYTRTKYETAAVESSGGALSVYGDGMLMYTLPDGYDARGIFHLIQSLRRDQKRILLFGSGPGSLLHNLLQTDIDILYYFEPDPELWHILLPYVRSFYRALGNKKLVVPGRELKYFLKKSKEKFDMIISIPPQPENIMLNRFYTQEFYSLCRRHLSEQGIIIAALHGFTNYMSTDKRNFIASIYNAFSNVFPVHIKTSGEIIYLIGAKKNGILPENIDILVSMYGKTRPADKHRFEKEITDNFSPEELRMLFEKTQLQYFDSVIAPAAKKTDANRDLKPDAYWKNIVLTAFKEQSVLYNMIRNYGFSPAIILLLSGMALLNIRRKHGSSSMMSGLIVYLSGFISISTMLIFILLFQNSQGIVYYRISLINALFMLGLGLGSFVFNRKRVLKLPYIFICIALTLISMLGIAIYEVQAFFWTLLIIFSFLSGAVFPTLFHSERKDYYTAASVLDSMDHFGAIAGSLLTVVFLVPLLGIQWTIILNAILIVPACIIGFVRFWD